MTKTTKSPRRSSTFVRAFKTASKLVLRILAFPIVRRRRKHVMRPEDIPLWLRDDIGLPPTEKRTPIKYRDEYGPM